VVKQLTVRGVDASLERGLRAEAKRRGLSLNRTALQLLRQALGGDSRARSEPKLGRHTDLDHLAGTWSEEEAAAFDAALVDRRRIDPELWRAAPPANAARHRESA